jgi:hypothetical protein
MIYHMSLWWIFWLASLVCFASIWYQCVCFDFLVWLGSSFAYLGQLQSLAGCWWPYCSIKHCWNSLENDISHVTWWNFWIASLVCFASNLILINAFWVPCVLRFQFCLCRATPVFDTLTWHWWTYCSIKHCWNNIEDEIW